MGYSSMMAIIPESYPINVRSIGVGWSNAWCKFGGVVSPVTLGIIFGLNGGIVIGVLLLALCYGVVGVVAAFYDEPKRNEEDAYEKL